MSTRPITAALLGVLMLSAMLAGPTLAKRPSSPSEEVPTAERPLTEQELAESDAKIAAAEAFLASPAALEPAVSTLACVTPNSEPAASDGLLPDDASIEATCSTPAYVLTVEARDQIRSHYCGPAVGQVIANYSWGMASGKNKYSQGTIAGWMGTDTYGSTDAHRLEQGLERATINAPRRPSNWNWVISYLTDSDKDGQYGDQLHDYVRANVSGSRMPLAIPVKPHHRTSQYHLSSWPRPVNSVGHWIAAYGWYAYWTNSDKPQIAYTDSSRDEGGSTGKFWDPTRHLAAMIREHTQRFVW